MSLTTLEAIDEGDERDDDDCWRSIVTDVEGYDTPSEEMPVSDPGAPSIWEAKVPFVYSESFTCSYDSSIECCGLELPYLHFFALQGVLIWVSAGAEI